MELLDRYGALPDAVHLTGIDPLGPFPKSVARSLHVILAVAIRNRQVASSSLAGRLDSFQDLNAQDGFELVHGFRKRSRRDQDDPGVTRL